VVKCLDDLEKKFNGARGAAFLRHGWMGARQRKKESILISTKNVRIITHTQKCTMKAHLQMKQVKSKVKSKRVRYPLPGRLTRFGRNVLHQRLKVV
jgi:hypothetical protein